MHARVWGAGQGRRVQVRVSRREAGEWGRERRDRWRGAEAVEGGAGHKHCGSQQSITDASRISLLMPKTLPPQNPK